MAYRIVYGPEPSATRKVNKPVSKIPLLTVGFFLLFLFLVRTCWPEGQQLLTRLLLPGDPAVTEAAIHTMVLELETGAPFSDALTAFCREVLSGVPLG